MKDLRPYSPNIRPHGDRPCTLDVLHHLRFLIGPAPCDDAAERIDHEKGIGCHPAMGVK